MNNLFAKIPTALIICGCSISPVPKDIQKWHQQAHKEVPVLKQNIKPCDIVFRMSDTKLFGGLFNFSKAIGEATESDFSHAVLVYRVDEDGIVLVDITATGVTRRYLIDWYLDPSRNVVVKRLKPEFQHIIPLVMSQLNNAIETDYLYDDKFEIDDNNYYCTELVDHCFRSVGYPLADKVRIKDFPKSKILLPIACFFTGIDIDTEVVIAGNDKIGLFSSKILDTIIDLR